METNVGTVGHQPNHLKPLVVEIRRMHIVIPDWVVNARNRLIAYHLGVIDGQGNRRRI